MTSGRSFPDRYRHAKTYGSSETHDDWTEVEECPNVDPQSSPVHQSGYKPRRTRLSPDPPGPGERVKGTCGHPRVVVRRPPPTRDCLGVTTPPPRPLAGTVPLHHSWSGGRLRLSTRGRINAVSFLVRFL